MASYYSHKATHSKEIPYSFRCEHCGKNSGTLLATIKGNEAEQRSSSNVLSDVQSGKLNQSAHDLLVKTVYRDYINATEKQIIDLAFKDKCPHCQKGQSWAISGMKNELASWPIVLTVFGIIVAVGTYFFTEDKSIMLSAVLGGVFVLAAVLVLIFKLIKINLKKKESSSVLQNNLPTIDWTAAQDLINEKLAKSNGKK